MDEQQTRDLTPGVAIPLLGLGTYQVRDADAAGAVAAALAAGYRHVDTAQGYRNERGVGEGLRRGMAANGLTRDDVVVTTKLWPGGSAPTSDGTARALDASLEALGLDHVDLYLVHTPADGDRRLDRWRALLEQHERGRARAVGVSNYAVRHLEEIEDAGLPLPHANQIELHPWSQQPDIVRHLEERSITPIAYSSLAPLPGWRTGHSSGKSDRLRAEGRRDDAPIAAVAARLGVSPARLLLRWAVQQGYPVLPRSTDPERIRENADVFSFRIDDADMAVLDGLDRGAAVAWRRDPTRTR